MEQSSVPDGSGGKDEEYMGWYGAFSLKYEGGDYGRFLSLAKLIIPNYPFRFEETADDTISCLRELSWYSAEKDVCLIMERLHDGDSITMTIDGETKPHDGENDMWLPCEVITFTKKNGDVLSENRHPDEDRYRSDIPGIHDMLEYELIYPTGLHETDTLKSYMEFLAAEFADDDGFIPVIREFLHDMLDTDRYKGVRYGKTIPGPWSPEVKKLNQAWEHFRTDEGAKEYLKSINNARMRNIPDA